MDFSTLVIAVLVAAVGYTLFKAFAKKADTNNDGVVSKEEAVAEVKAEVKAVEEKAKATATKAKAAVKKATTRKPKSK